MLSRREAINNAYLQAETPCVNALLSHLDFTPAELQKIHDQAYRLVAQVRSKRLRRIGVDAFFQQYDLSNEAGIALMCIAEAMLRIPDAQTKDKLIHDKLTSVDWKAHIGKSKSWVVNFTTRILMLASAGKINKLLIRIGVEQAMKILAKQFIMGMTIQSALSRARNNEAKGYTYSYDMLGEAARTQEDADQYFQAYAMAINYIGHASTGKNCITSSGISIKLSALYPRYTELQRERVYAELVPKVLQLAQLAKRYNINFTIDAEETARLEISLDIIEKVFSDPSLHNWQGFGLALQAYQPRAWYVIDWLIDLSRRERRRMMVRLVKGAYWDSEIKQAQVEGRDNYPVFTRKANTDISYLACAKKLLAASDTIYPQFATHNAHTLSAILTMLPASGRARDDLEFQCLHGMGQTLYDQIIGKQNLDIRCRIYAPVGTYKDLLPYLVRRLLENGANTSFVNNVIDEKLQINDIIVDPIAKVKSLRDKEHPHIPLPANLFGASRKNSRGTDLTNRAAVEKIISQIQIYKQTMSWSTLPATADLQAAVVAAQQAFAAWNASGVENRAACLERAADLFEENRIALFTLLIHEAGKTLPDAIGEAREAVDYCRYYAQQARLLSSARSIEGRGVALCISPWNFPLAIFLGQVVGALVAGNTVLAKPAEQTSLIAAFSINLLHQAGIPREAVQLIIGRGSVIGNFLLPRAEIQAVVFTGSTETAQTINGTLATRGAVEVPFIAETGGQNAMIVDSSALLEQVIDDVLTSAFNSAGQRCSALRVLFIQDDIADAAISMLRGAMMEMRVGDQSLLATDVGPVIDAKAKQDLQAHAEKMDKLGKLIYQISVDPALKDNFFALRAYEIANLGLLTHEVFGPILHVIRYATRDLSNVITQIKQTGYGLTLGIQSRIDSTVSDIHEHLPIGNTYVNRNMIGAVVGVQPFGGEGLSGTGPKAGGPYYVQRLCRLVSQKINIANDRQQMPVVQRMQLLRDMSKLLSINGLDEMVEHAEQILVSPQILPGPTGEFNQLELHPRGLVACFSADNADIFATIKQWFAALVAGNDIIIGVAPQYFSYYKAFLRAAIQVGFSPQLIQSLDGNLDKIASEIIKTMPLQAVMLNADLETAAIFYQGLASREGALIPLILVHEYENYLWRLSVERTLSINVTAKGGNTTLLSLKE